MNTHARSQPTLVLMILDGWGYNENHEHNAIAQAHTPHWQHWWQTCPHLLLDASGSAVGLPADQMGNSEVGHMHIGAGRLIPQDFTRINQAITDGSFATNAVLLQMIADTQRHGHAMHVIGLLSAGGVHSHEQHLFAFLALCAEKGLTDICLHLLLDGRDTPPKSALESLSRLNDVLAKNKHNVRVCSITGRHYAMDRDQRWDRIEPLYQLLTTEQTTPCYEDAATAIAAYYAHGITDEFIPATRIGKPHPLVDGDAVFFFNFRSDRMRQLTQALIAPSFDHFSRVVVPKLSHAVSMTHYAEYLATEIVFPPYHVQHCLGEILATHGLHQLRLAETEKYAHVTFFFNGGQETAFTHEDRILIPSPKVTTYNLQPEMSAPQVTAALLSAIASQQYDVIICNYANADMVAHTGDYPATIKAIEHLDTAIYAVATLLKQFDGNLLITSDHGNADCMFNESTQQAHTAHTNEPVPFLFIGNPIWQTATDHGTLCDIAPTILQLLNLPIPPEMSGQSLLRLQGLRVKDTRTS